MPQPIAGSMELVARVRTVFVVGLAAAVLAAQAPRPAATRKPLVGTVAAADGPVARATVTLVGFTSYFDPALDRADVVAVRADAGGRFVAELLPYVPYCGFACGEPRADGSAVCSAVQGWFGCGAVVEFACSGAVVPLRTELRGLDAWRERGPVTVGATPFLGDEAAPLPIPAAALRLDGAHVSWPPLPYGQLAVADATGLPLFLGQVPQVDGGVLALDPPLAVPCRVVDENGNGVAGAAIRLRGRGFADGGIDRVQTIRCRDQRELLTTDADGRAVLTLPAAAGQRAPANLACTATAPGRQERLSGMWGSHWFRDDHAVAEGAEQELRFTLPKAEPLRGRIANAGDLAARGASVRLLATAKLFTIGRSFSHDARSYATRLAADGSYEFDHLPDELYSSRLVIVPDDGAMPMAIETESNRGSEAPVDFRSFAVLRLGVLDAQSGPASGHVVYVQQDVPPGQPLGAMPQRWCTDAAGRLQVTLWSGRWFVYAADRDAFAWCTVELEPGARADAELRLAAYPRVRGLLRDDRGEPVAGARLMVTGTRTGPVDQPEESLARTFLRQEATRLLGDLRTGADGSFAIPFAPLPSLVFSVAFRSGGRTTESFDLVPAAAPLTLSWQ